MSARAPPSRIDRAYPAVRRTSSDQPPVKRFSNQWFAYGHARLERVRVVSSVGARRTEGAPVEADSQEIALDPADTTPHRHECVEAAPMYDDITQAIQALTVRRFRMERDGTPRDEAYRRVRANLGLALGLGGDAEGAYPRTC